MKISTKPIIDIYDLEIALSHQYGKQFMKEIGDSVIDFLFGFDDVTDGCYKLYNFSELKEPVYMWDKADRTQKENCIRAFLQDILPGHKEVLIHIYW
jgi:hypothetical protein